MSISNSKYAAPQAPAEPAPLDGYYIIRGFRGDDALTSVMDQPRDKAIAIMQETQPTRGKGPLLPDGTRDQKEYYQDRDAAEHWVRDNANLPAGASDRPVYFAITNDKDKVLEAMRRGATEGSHIIVAPVTPEMAASLTITAGDSMGHHFAVTGYREKDGSVPFLDPNAPLPGKVMNFADWTKNAAANGIGEGEAQLWSRDPLPGAKTYNSVDMTPFTPPAKKEAGVETSSILGPLVSNDTGSISRFGSVAPVAAAVTASPATPPPATAKARPAALKM